MYWIKTVCEYSSDFHFLWIQCSTQDIKKRHTFNAIFFLQMEQKTTQFGCNMPLWNWCKSLCHAFITPLCSLFSLCFASRWRFKQNSVGPLSALSYICYSNHILQTAFGVVEFILSIWKCGVCELASALIFFFSI